MDVYLTAFTYPRPIRPPRASSPLPPPHSQFDFGQSTSEHVRHPPPPQRSSADAERRATETAESVHRLSVYGRSVHGCHVVPAMIDNRSWNFLITGPAQNAVATRGMILKECPIENYSTVRAPRSDILDSPFTSPSLKAYVRESLDNIASQTGAHIAVINVPNNQVNPADGNGNVGLAGLDTERVCELLISGSEDCIDITRIKLLVMLDKLSGLHAESCDIDHKLHSIIAGRKRHDLQVIQEETATNIYLPSPLLGVVSGEMHKPGAPSANTTSRWANTIWITGEFFGVQRARDMLTNVAMLKSKSVLSRDAAILPRKLDWMVTDRADELKTIMSDNATFIQFPVLGSATSLITVIGDDRVNIHRTIRSVMQLACHYYVASFWLLPIQFNALLPPTSISPAAIAPIITQISTATGAEVIFKANSFEIHGLEPEVRKAVTLLLEVDMLQNYHHEIRFQLELANEHREFITGKKNGKINKIMQTTNVKIKLETFNDHNFLIDIAGPDASVLTGLSLVQEELPAEISFHVPEVYHKRIIGVGGRSIQRIMKKFGVYVKFSNSEEFTQLGGYNDNSDNVIARTPTKNAYNLENLRSSVMELVNPKDKDFVNETVSIPRRYHRILLGEKSIFIHDIEAKTNSRVYFPDKSSASDIITIFGPESQVQIAATMLLDHVPFEADWNVPPHPDLPRICASDEFLEVIERVKQELHVSITPNIQPVSPPASSSSHVNGSEKPREVTFKFRCQRSNTDFLVTARELLEKFLKGHQISQFPNTVHKRTDSYTDSFAHFDSKVLPTARSRGHESMDMGRSPDIPNGSDNRRLRLAASSPDVKSLFHAPPVFISYEQEKQDFAPLPVPVEGFRQQPPIGSGIPHRTRHSEDALKRGSDSSLEAKIKGQQSLSKPRSLQNRAQSLDLTMSLARVAESANSSSNLGPPDSPNLSGCDTGGNSSPASVSYPSVYDSVTGPHGHLLGSLNSLEDGSVEELSRSFNHFGM